MRTLSTFFTIFALTTCSLSIPDQFRHAKSPYSNNDEFINPIGRITNGERAALGQFPYHAVIFMESSDNQTFVCGGALLKNNYVITSASCLVNYTAFHVYLGIVDIGSRPLTYAWKSDVITDLNDIITHAGYDSQYDDNNIGLIRLSNAPTTLTDHQNIDIIGLPMSSDASVNLVGMMATATGFGDVNDDISTDFLHFVAMPVISNAACREHYLHLVTPRSLCTNTTMGRSTCKGDQGGPLTAEIAPGRHAIIGVVNFGSPQGCTAGHPVVFTRVTSYLEWLAPYVGTDENDGSTVESTTQTTTPGGSSMVEINGLVFVVFMMIHFCIFK